MNNINEIKQMLELLLPEHLLDITAFVDCLLIEQEAAAIHQAERYAHE